MTKWRRGMTDVLEKGMIGVDYETPLEAQLTAIGLTPDDGLIERIDPDLASRRRREKWVIAKLVAADKGEKILGLAASTELTAMRGGGWYELVAYRAANPHETGPIVAHNAVITKGGQTHCAMIVGCNGSSKLTTIPINGLLPLDCQLLEVEPVQS